MNAQEKKRATLLRDQVLKTWKPPLLQRDANMATVAQTAVMQTIAWTHGKVFLGPLTPHQTAAIDQGLAVFENLFGKQP